MPNYIGYRDAENRSDRTGKLKTWSILWAVVTLLLLVVIAAALIARAARDVSAPGDGDSGKHILAFRLLCWMMSVCQKMYHVHYIAYMYMSMHVYICYQTNDIQYTSVHICDMLVCTSVDCILRRFCASLNLIVSGLWF